MGTGPAAAALNMNEKAVVEEIISETLQRFRIADDLYFLQNHFLVFIAEK